MVIHQFSLRLKDAGLFILYICTIVQNSFWFICTKHTYQLLCMASFLRDIYIQHMVLEGDISRYPVQYKV